MRGARHILVNFSDYTCSIACAANACLNGGGGVRGWYVGIVNEQVPEPVIGPSFREPLDVSQSRSKGVSHFDSPKSLRDCGTKESDTVAPPVRRVRVTDLTYQLNGGFKPTLKRFADLGGPDFFPTPRWATFALIKSEKFSGEIWECACGDGAMSRVLEQTGQPVRSSDLYDRGYGEVGVDFLRAERAVDNIVTNPPYNCAEGFVACGLKLAKRKLALLLRLAFLEGANRANTIFSKTPPARVWVFSERITFYPSGVEPKGSGTTAYAWFVWDKQALGPTELKWINPGYKAKFSGSRDGLVEADQPERR